MSSKELISPSRSENNGEKPGTTGESLVLIFSPHEQPFKIHILQQLDVKKCSLKKKKKGLLSSLKYLDAEINSLRGILFMLIRNKPSKHLNDSDNEFGSHSILSFGKWPPVSKSCSQLPNILYCL